MDAYAVTREHKLALIVGFSLFLVLGVLISDHFSKSRQVEMAENIQPASAREMGGNTPGVRMASEPGVSGAAGAALPLPSHQSNPPQRPDLAVLPGVVTTPGGPSQPIPGTIVVDQQPPRGNGVLLLANPGRLPLPQGESHPELSNPITPPVAGSSQIPVQRHEVKEGDTLYRIAVKYYGDGKLWEKVRDYNKDRVTSNGLREGVTLMIPPKDVLLGKPYVPAASSSAGGSGPTTITMDSGRGNTGAADPAKAGKLVDAPKPGGDYREYVVKEGDTLVAISRKMLNSGKRFNEIIEANKGTLSDPESLSVGMKLRIPAK
jgi:LysM repeat protein